MSSPSAFAGIQGYYYIIITGFCLFSVALVKYTYVETAHHTLEEISIAFGDRACLSDDQEVVNSSHLQKPEAQTLPTVDRSKA